MRGLGVCEGLGSLRVPRQVRRGWKSAVVSLSVSEFPGQSPATIWAGR